MKNITQQFLDKLDAASIDDTDLQNNWIKLVSTEAAKQILQDFEIALLKEIDNQKTLTNKQLY